MKAQTIQTDNSSNTYNQIDTLDNSKKNESQRCIFKGIVLDVDRNPLVGATVQIKSIFKGAITNTEGKFEIDLTNIIENYENLEVEILFVGLNKTKFSIDKSNFNNNEYNINIILTEGNINYTVFTVDIRKPWYERFWNKIKRIF